MVRGLVIANSESHSWFQSVMETERNDWSELLIRRSFVAEESGASLRSHDMRRGRQHDKGKELLIAVSFIEKDPDILKLVQHRFLKKVQDKLRATDDIYFRYKAAQDIKVLTCKRLSGVMPNWFRHLSLIATGEK